MKRVTVTTRRLAVRKDPSDPELYEEVIELLKNGDEILVDMDTTIYSWNDLAYHPVKTKAGNSGYSRIVI